MTTTAMAPPSEPALEDVPRSSAGEWRTAVLLGRIEGVRLAKVLAVPAALGGLLSLSSGPTTALDLRAHSYNLAFNFLLCAAVALVASHRAVTRPRREGVEELLAPLPAPERAATAGHLLAVGGGLAVALLVTGVAMVALVRVPNPIGEAVWSEIAVGPLLVVGAGCLGVLLARMWPQPFVPYLACLAIAVFELSLANRVASGARWLVFWVEGSIWWAVLRHSTLHLVYLLGLVAMAAVGALVRHGVTRRLAVAGTVAIAVTAVAAGLQMRQPADEWRERNAMFAAPASVQSCEVRRDVRYCTFHRFDDMRDLFAERVERVRAAMPAERWPAGLAVTQRVTALDLQYASPRLPHLPDVPRGVVRQPDDGEIHPAVEFGWSPVQELGFGTQVASRALALPLVPDPQDGDVCDASDQGRAVIALWLGSQAEDAPGRGLRWLVERAETALPTGDATRAVLAAAEVDVYGGFVVSLDDARLALRLLERDRAAVRRVVAEHWTTLVDPSTPRASVASLLGVKATAPSPRAGEATVVDAGSGHASGRSVSVRVGGPCR